MEELDQINADLARTLRGLFPEIPMNARKIRVTVEMRQVPSVEVEYVARQAADIGPYSLFGESEAA